MNPKESESCERVPEVTGQRDGLVPMAEPR